MAEQGLQSPGAPVRLQPLFGEGCHRYQPMPGCVLDRIPRMSFWNSGAQTTLPRRCRACQGRGGRQPLCLLEHLQITSMWPWESDSSCSLSWDLIPCSQWGLWRSLLRKRQWANVCHRGTVPGLQFQVAHLTPRKGLGTHAVLCPRVWPTDTLDRPRPGPQHKVGWAGQCPALVEAGEVGNFSMSSFVCGVT